MVYVNKKFIFNWLTSSSLLLAGAGSVHGARQAIDIVLDEGHTIRVTPNKIFANTNLNVIVIKDENKAHIQIGSTHIDVDRSKPFDRLIRSLRVTAGVKSAILVKFSPDERYENKIIEFNKTFRSDLPFSDQIQLRRKFCSSLLKYQKQDSKRAKRNLPIEQCKLACILANSADESTEEISFLQEAVELLTQSATAGCQLAQRNLPIEQYKLGVVLANSARGSADKIPLLRKSIRLLTESVNAGDPYAKEKLPIVQNNLGVALTNSAQGSAEEVPLLREAVKLLTQSLFGGYQRAEKELFAAEYKLGCALANSTQGSVDEILRLSEARYLLENSINFNFQNAKNLPLIHATLEKINQRLESLNVVSNILYP